MGTVSRLSSQHHRAYYSCQQTCKSKGRELTERENQAIIIEASENLRKIIKNNLSLLSL